jgi:two-component system LytT family sensor kinase
MVRVGTLLTNPVLLGGIALAALVALAAVVLIFRARHERFSVASNAVLGALSRISQAGAALREGLDQASADQAAPHLREVLACLAVGVADDEGTLLSWDGEAAEHYEDLIPAVGTAMANHRREHVKHDDLACRLSNCKMRAAVIVPLLVENRLVGALVVVGSGDKPQNRQLIRMADEVAKFICTQLQLASLQESRQQLAQAEVRALRAQISPHFVYNALNTISSLIRTDPERARELLLEFAEFTRYSFRTSGMFTALADELRNIDRYLMLERARYGPRVNVRLKIAPEVLNVVVPFLVLQPLVENAVRHGLAKKPGGGTVSVIAQDHGTEALIMVEDDGVGMDADRLTADLRDAHSTGAHVGIGNINQRMRSLFGDDYALAIETAPNEGMKVTLRVPKYVPGVRSTPEAYTAQQEPIDPDPAEVVPERDPEPGRRNVRSAG